MPGWGWPGLGFPSGALKGPSAPACLCLCLPGVRRGGQAGEALTPRGPSRSPLDVPAPSLPRAIWLTSLTVVPGSPGEPGQLSRITLTY